MSEPPSTKPAAGEPTSGGPGTPVLQRQGLSVGRIALLLIIGVTAVGIFVLPYFVPVSGPSTSVSWEFGFSNTAARALIALLLMTVLAWRFLADGGASSLVARAVDGSGAQEGSWWPLLIVMVVFQVIACAGLSIWYRFLPYAYYGEMAYFMQRLGVMMVGRIPYRDFGFDYGPAMLWMPVLIYRLSHARLSVEMAYFITLLVHYVLGFSLIAYSVSQVNSRARAIIFALMALPFFSLTMGLNYAPLRFIIAPASILAVRQLIQVRRGVRWRAAAVAVAVFLLPIMACAISPEMGIAVILGLGFYFLWFLFGARRLDALPGLAVVAGAAAVGLFFPRGSFDAVFSFSRGGNDFPLLPSIHVLSMLAAAVFVLPSLGVMALRRTMPKAPFCAGMAVMLGFLLLPATGRCDAGHVLLNSLGIFLLALSAVTFMRARWRVLILAGYFLVFPLMGEVAFYYNYLPSFRRVVLSRSQLAGISYVRDNGGDPGAAIHFSKLLPVDPWLLTLPHVPIGLPLGADETTERFLLLTGRAAPEYYIVPHDDLFEPGQLERKFADLGGMRSIYVPRFYLKYLKPTDRDAEAAERARQDDAFLSKLFELPVSLSPVNRVFDPYGDVMVRIAHEYRVSKACPYGLLLGRGR